MTTKTVIVKLNSTCNLACQYCYATDRLGMPTIEAQMKMGVVEKIIKEFATFHPDRNGVHFIWHGGEPLLSRIDYFKEIVEIQNKYFSEKTLVQNSIQTNGTLLNAEWVDFFAENQFDVGVSLDGTHEIHNALRIYSNGMGSFTEVINGINLLRSQKVKFGILAVISKYSLTQAETIFDFFVQNDIKSFDFLPYIEFDKNSQKKTTSSITPKQFAQFMILVFDRWFEQDDPEIRIRFFENSLTGLLGGFTTTCTFSGKCSNFLSIAPNGDVHHCDWFIGQTDKCFGNINEGLKNILAKTKYKDYTCNINQPHIDCFECKWKLICNGGCFYHREINKGKYYFCASRKLIFQHIELRTKPVLSALND